MNNIYNNTENDVDLNSFSDEEISKMTEDSIKDLVKKNQDNQDNQDKENEENNNNSEQVINTEASQETQDSPNDESGTDTPNESKEASTDAIDPFKGESTNEDNTKLDNSSVDDINKDNSNSESTQTSDKTNEINNIDLNEYNTALGFMNKITTPFKADGKEFTVKSPEDAIRLMQMGVNYNRKMQELNILRAKNKVLEDNGIDDEKLNVLIDIAKGNKEAIVKLAKDNEIDLLDLDLDEEEADKYIANDYSPDLKAIAFEDSLKQASSTEAGQLIISDIENYWDDNSKGSLYENPNILDILTEQKNNGIYDTIMNEVIYQNNLGNLNGMSFLEAYQQIGSILDQQGVLNKNTPNANNTNQNNLQTNINNRNNTANNNQNTGFNNTDNQNNQNDNLNAVSIPRKSPVIANTETPNEVKDYSNISDEEFLALSIPG